MKTLDLPSNEKYIFDTYCLDSINRNFYLHKFVEMLNSIENGFAVALGGRWGSGKTFFIKQAKMILDTYNEKNKNIDVEKKDAIEAEWEKYAKPRNIKLKNHACVYYDAWKYDNDDNPVLSIVYEIVKELDYRYEFKEDGNLVELVCSVFDAVSGMNTKGVYETFAKREALFENIKKERDIENTINHLLNVILENRGDRLIIFVDELDRCKPSYAVDLLEKIKHYFLNEKVTFVFSINPEELVKTIKKCYGYDFDSSRYLDRFFDLRMDIPKVDMDCYYENLGYSSKESRYVQDIAVKEIIRKFGFEMREVSRYLKLIDIAVYNLAHSNRSLSDQEIMIMYYIIPLMLGLKLYDTEKYYYFVDGKDCGEMINIFSVFKRHRIFQNLLNVDESYTGENKAGTAIEIETKIRQVYDAIFNTTYDNNISSIHIGNVCFDASGKNTINEIVNLLSTCVNFDARNVNRRIY